MDTLQETICEIIADRYPGASTYWLTAAADDPAIRMKAGDMVVWARAEPRLGEMAVVEESGMVGCKRCEPGPGNYQGVVVAFTRELER